MIDARDIVSRMSPRERAEARRNGLIGSPHLSAIPRAACNDILAELEALLADEYEGPPAKGRRRITLRSRYSMRHATVCAEPVGEYVALSSRQDTAARKRAGLRGDDYWISAVDKDNNRYHLVIEEDCDAAI